MGSRSSMPHRRRSASLPVPRLIGSSLMTSTRDLLKQAPSDAHLNDAAVMACAGGNRALTREALQHANFRYSDVYWYNIGTSWHPYEICRKWAGGE